MPSGMPARPVRRRTPLRPSRTACHTLSRSSPTEADQADAGDDHRLGLWYRDTRDLANSQVQRNAVVLAWEPCSATADLPARPGACLAAGICEAGTVLDCVTSANRKSLERIRPLASESR